MLDVALKRPQPQADDLISAWFEAEHQARAAYVQWNRRRDWESYAVYRAHADQADAAQDELARRHA